jgi:hypothetical protein
MKSLLAFTAAFFVMQGFAAAAITTPKPKQAKNPTIASGYYHSYRGHTMLLMLLQR